MSEADNKGGGPDTPSLLPDQTKTSRETSPPRVARSASAIPQLSTRSRKGSQEFSPTRNNALSGTLSTIPSAAAVQRALSAQRPVPTQGNVDGPADGPRNERSFRSGHTSPSWPASPRLKSPPPSMVTNRAHNNKKNENEQVSSNTSIKRLATVSTPDTAAAMQIPDSGKEQATSHGTLRPVGRGTSTQSSNLETVAESSLPTTPSIGPVQDPIANSRINATPLSNNEAVSQGSLFKDGDGSGNEDTKSAADKGETTKKSSNSVTARPPANLAKRSLTNLTASKSRPADPPRTMTVETEPVTSMPQLLSGERGLSGRDGNGSVRTKPSSETIKPKKDKKRSARKAPSLHSGTVTSKADLFEAKVASAVDEADTSDSDETFVYESNPPEQRGHRHHSRTPSATSLVSQDQPGRNRHGIRSGSHAIGGKKSMKFSNSAYNNHLDDEEAAAEGRGSARNASTPRPHHIGRHGKAVHGSILDNNSPFTQANQARSPRTTHGNHARNSRPNSPRLSNGRLLPSPKKGDPFDIYDDAADDERTPLMGSVRVTRSRHSRRPNGSVLRDSGYFDEVDGSCCGRFGGCFLLVLVVLVICVGVATFVVGLNQPLVDVKIRHLQNILASEQELMLDLHVDATNTNFFAISVNDLDVNLFAESPYVGTSWELQSQERRRLRWAKRDSTDGVDTNGFRFGFPPFHSDNGVDEGTDSIDEPGPQKMLLGRILEFDSPLVFDASPIRRSRSTAVGEIRLAKPGNHTEVSGSERWERVLRHPFDLIVRGVIKYQLPLSSKTRSVKIASRATVEPDTEVGDEPEAWRQTQ
jgi:Vacuolar segregation subunit 7